MAARLALVLAAGVLIGSVAFPTPGAQAQAAGGLERAKPAPLELSAQKRRKAARARTRITVRPSYGVLRRATIYPTPFDIHAPGPGFVRQCSSWLAPELRPSGPVIVPRMRCWWQPG
jgi:hypothetical protein